MRIHIGLSSGLSASVHSCCQSVDVKGLCEDTGWTAQPSRWNYCVFFHPENWFPLIMSSSFLCEQHCRRFFYSPRLTLNQPFPTLTREQHKQPVDWRAQASRHFRIGALWEKKEGKKRKKKTQLPWKLPSCDPLLRNVVADVPNSQGRACTFQPSDAGRTCIKSWRLSFGWVQ